MAVSGSALLLDPAQKPPGMPPKGATPRTSSLAGSAPSPTSFSPSEGDTDHLRRIPFSPQANIVQSPRSGSKYCTGVMCKCAVSPWGRKLRSLGSAGQGSIAPRSIVSQTGGNASLPQLAFALARSARVVEPGLLALTGYPMPSLPAATQISIANKQAGPAEPQSSSDQRPGSSGKTSRSGRPRLSKAVLRIVSGVGAMVIMAPDGWCFVAPACAAMPAPPPGRSEGVRGPDLSK